MAETKPEQTGWHDAANAADEFAASLVGLYGALTGEPVARATGAVEAAFAAADAAGRGRSVLRALDEAIAALEVAQRLADAYHGVSAGGAQPTPPALRGAADDDALGETYRAFAASQPAYQDLYHYRNALAAWLRTANTATSASGEGDAHGGEDDAGGGRRDG